ncbi:DNA phosphorothioation-dependent restriction protein DptF [Salisediminibacterium beveridgei]|uniref:Uncharacterized protein n=1 Tax=Salisediminibacterium beveridgei TaxID=632773 RepID=A0A1D7QWZ9_9BACI|nr:DNA phosphorothioation-dependent restriction protein DptF [Salisediminibacterium beveridgei]AOM83532.1 hypothetical protein BBEV_2174 [Salisediminibacterium beveridgei]
MKLSELLEEIDKINLHKQKNQGVSLKKPLLLLLLISIIHRGQISENKFIFKELEDDLDDLIKLFGGRRLRSSMPEQPFNYLVSSNIWEIKSKYGLGVISDDKVSKKIMRDTETYGFFVEGVFDLLIESEDNRALVSSFILNKFWADSIQYDIKKRLYLPETQESNMEQSYEENGVEIMGHSDELFYFLKNIEEELYNLASKMEDRLFDDPKASCMYARSLLESILENVLKNEQKLDVLSQPLVEKIKFINMEGYLPKSDPKVFNSMYIIRKTGNKAIHDKDFSSIEDAIKLYRESFVVASWFAEVYGDGSIQIPKYREPLKSRQEFIPKDQLESVLNELLKEKQVNFMMPDSNKSEIKQNEDNLETEKNTLIKEDLPTGKSYLLRELRRLQESSMEAVESPEEFSKFKQYMHVDRKIQSDIEAIIKEESESNKSSLIILSGSVGDGKSHLLSYFKENLPEISNFKIYNDATESYDRKKTAVETLTEELISFSDQHLDKNNEKMIIAMNLGILNKFLEADHGEYSYFKLKEFIEKSKVFERDHSPYFSEKPYSIVTFSEYPPFELSENGAQSEFFQGILNRIFVESDSNPFYEAFKLDVNEHKGFKGILHYNYQYLMNSQVQYVVVQSMIRAILMKKIVVSTRAVFNFIANIIIPEGYDEELEFGWSDGDFFENSFPNLMFNRKNRSIMLDAMAEIDPIHYRNKDIDNIILDINTKEDRKKVVDEHLSNNDYFPLYQKIFETDSQGANSSLLSNTQLSKMLIRVSFLTNSEFYKNLIPDSYISFLRNLYSFNKRNTEEIRKFSMIVYSAMMKWRGTPKNNYIYIKDYFEFKVAQKLNINASADHLKAVQGDLLRSFDLIIRVGFTEKHSKKTIYLDIDYYLYQLLLAVEKGYQQNYKDMEDAINFIEFIDRIISCSNNEEELLIHMPKEKKIYRLEYSDLSGYTFDRE